MFLPNLLSRKLDALVKAHVNRGTFSGSVLVRKGQQVLLRKGYGQASAELGVSVRPDHAFRIGSVGKTLTALAVLRLVDTGRLSLETGLETFIPDFPDAQNVTLHQLLSNTSGIADHITREDAAQWCGRPHTLPELLSLIAEAPRLFRPGERLGYSNANWALLAAVLERITGQTFAKALTDLVLTPLGMTRTTVGTDNPLVPGRVSGYDLRDLEVRPAAHIDLSVEVGAGGVYSTVDDLYRLKRALAEDGFLEPETRKHMMTPTPQSSAQEAFGYGYGVMTGHRFGHTWWGHSGGTFGFTALFTCYPGGATGEDMTVIVLSNFGNGSAAGLEQALAAAVFGEPYSLPQDAPQIDVPRDVLAAYEGRYRTEYAGRALNAQITLDGEHLYIQFPLLPKAQLQALSSERFQGRLKGGEVTFNFVCEAGQVTGINVDWSGQKLFAPRLKPSQP